MFWIIISIDPLLAVVGSQVVPLVSQFVFISAGPLRAGGGPCHTHIHILVETQFYESTATVTLTVLLSLCHHSISWKFQTFYFRDCQYHNCEGITPSGEREELS